MYGTAEEKQGRQQETANNQLVFFAGIDCLEYTIQTDGAKKNDEVVKDDIYIIVAKTKDIANRQKLDDKVAGEVIPVRIS
jgi:hypothetical protein